MAFPKKRRVTKTFIIFRINNILIVHLGFKRRSTLEFENIFHEFKYNMTVLSLISIISEFIKIRRPKILYNYMYKSNTAQTFSRIWDINHKYFFSLSFNIKLHFLKYMRQYHIMHFFLNAFIFMKLSHIRNKVNFAIF